MDRFRLVLAAAALACTPAFCQNMTLPPAPGAQIVNINPQPGTFSEPGIAVNPRNPQQVVMVYQYPAGASYSADGGKTWSQPVTIGPPDYHMSGDVSIAFDTHGHAIMDCIAFDKLGTFNYWAHGATRNAILNRRSLDGGQTWEPEVRTVVAQPTQPGIPFEDKPYIVADPGHSRYAGNLYIGWTRWTLTDSRMLFSRSTDGGVTWSEPIEIAQDRGLPRDDNGALEGWDGAVAPDGTLYSVWASGDYLVMTESHDGGKTFSKTHNIVTTAPTMFAIEGMDRANGFPQIGIDPRSGNLYVTWSDYRNGEVDVFLIASKDHGRTWSEPIKVNNDPVHDGAEHFFQWLAVDPVSGAVNVVFYDRREDPTNRKQIVVLARSTDEGRSFQNYAWTSEPFNPKGVFMGDYLALTAYGDKVYGAWPVKPADATGTIVQVGVADFSRTE